MKRHETVGAALRRDCFGAFWWDRGIKPLLRFDHDHDHDQDQDRSFGAYVPLCPLSSLW